MELINHFVPFSATEPASVFFGFSGVILRNSPVAVVRVKQLAWLDFSRFGITVGAHFVLP